MAARFWLILLATLVIVEVPFASAGVIFDNFPGTGGITGGDSFQLGDEVTVMASAPRVVTELDLGFSQGNVGTATAKVTVPHSQNGAPAIDDGPHYIVLGGCP